MYTYDNLSTEIPKMLKISEIAELYGLPVHFVRALVNNGEVVATRVGNKILVNYNKFGEYLNSNTLRCVRETTPTKPNITTRTRPRISPISRSKNSQQKK